MTTTSPTVFPLLLAHLPGLFIVVAVASTAIQHHCSFSRHFHAHLPVSHCQPLRVNINDVRLPLCSHRYVQSFFFIRPLTANHSSVDLHHAHWHGNGPFPPLILDFKICAVAFLMPFIPPPYPVTRRCQGSEEVPLRFVQASNQFSAGRPYYMVSPR